MKALVIKVNGKDVNLENEVTIEELLVLQNIVRPDYVTVQVNNKFLEQDRYHQVMVKDHDAIEFLFFMGGGSF
ncbi:MAG TPA: sulfur carrier protein ThiS [Desulfosporosinus sp.]|nr:sulfur carrier protein ThiS [Desulfosporosinus sp.]